MTILTIKNVNSNGSNCQTVLPCLFEQAEQAEQFNQKMSTLMVAHV